MKTVLYVNHAHTTVCGVYDFGLRHFNAINRSSAVNFAYVACADANEYLAVCAELQPDAVIVNYMPWLMPWVPAVLGKYRTVTFAVPHNYEPAELDQLVAQHSQFDYLLICDPTLDTTNRRVFTTGRPIPPGAPHNGNAGSPIHVGSFGFAFPHKNYPAVAAEVNASFSEAVFNLHMPEAYFNGAQGAPLYTEGILAACQAEIHKPGISVHHTNAVLPEGDVVRRLAANDINALLYVPGQHNAGLSSALDYMIAARRPILVSDCAMFRHVRDGVSIWPEVRMSTIAEHYEEYQERADALYASESSGIVAATDAVMASVL